MTFAIISDIHSNLEALNSVLEDIKKRKIEKIYCLGDIVGYGASPNECIELIKNNKIETIYGNHDIASLTLENIENFNTHAKQAALWTNRILTKENKNYIDSLKKEIQLEDILFIHSSLIKENNYVVNVYAALNELKFMQKNRKEIKLCFFGHTHIKAIFSNKKDNIVSDAQTTIVLKEKTKYMINPGSVGQPRDGNYEASYGIYNDSDKEFKHILVPYDIKTAKQKIYNESLPNYLGDRLEKGK